MLIKRKPVLPGKRKTRYMWLLYGLAGRLRGARSLCEDIRRHSTSNRETYHASNEALDAVDKLRRLLANDIEKVKTTPKEKF